MVIPDDSDSEESACPVYGDFDNHHFADVEQRYAAFWFTNMQLAIVTMVHTLVALYIHVNVIFPATDFL